jgi:hypothetical protein
MNACYARLRGVECRASAAVATALSIVAETRLTTSTPATYMHALCDRCVAAHTGPAGVCRRRSVPAKVHCGWRCQLDTGASALANQLACRTTHPSLGARQRRGSHGGHHSALRQDTAQAASALVPLHECRPPSTRLRQRSTSACCTAVAHTSQHRHTHIGTADTHAAAAQRRSDSSTAMAAAGGQHTAPNRYRHMVKHQGRLGAGCTRSDCGISVSAWQHSPVLAVAVGAGIVGVMRVSAWCRAAAVKPICRRSSSFAISFTSPAQMSAAQRRWHCTLCECAWL